MTFDWWTLGLQTINIAVLVWLLQRFFWRPVAAAIEQRRAAVQGAVAEAEAKRAQATDALAGIERTRAGFAAEREAVLAAAHADAEKARAARLDEAATEATAVGAAAQAALAKQAAAAEAAWAERSGRLAVDVARRLAARLDGAAVRASFLDWLLDAIRALPASARQAMAGADLQAVSAAAISPADQARCQAAIGDALGFQRKLTFAADPALIAGLELHGAQTVVSNSWRADLDQILADLRHDSGR